MPISDKKKVQTLINRVGNDLADMRARMASINATKALYTAASPDITGTPLEGNLAAVNNALTSLETSLNLAAFTAMINAVVPSHREEAL